MFWICLDWHFFFFFLLESLVLCDISKQIFFGVFSNAGMNTSDEHWEVI